MVICGEIYPNWPDFYIYNIRIHSIHPKIITKTCPATLMLRKKSFHFAVNSRVRSPSGQVVLAVTKVEACRPLLETAAQSATARTAWKGLI